jgi:hypothetical protein
MPKVSSVEPRLDSAPVIEPAFLTESQVADYLGVHPHQLYLHRRRGTGPKFVVHGIRVRYPIDVVREWAAQLPRFASTAAAYAKHPKRAKAAAKQSAGSVVGRKTRWSKAAAE